MNGKEEQRDAEIVAERDALERKQDLAVLQLMEDTPKVMRKAKAEEIGLPWDEYVRLLGKYRHIIERYRKERKLGTAVGERCNWDGCNGKIEAMNGPCYCSECDWEEGE